MVTRPWRLAAFDVAIRTPLPSSLHPSVLCLFTSTPWRWRWRSCSCFTLHSPDPALHARPPDSPLTPSQSAFPLPVPPDHPFQSSILPSSHSRLNSFRPSEAFNSSLAHSTLPATSCVGTACHLRLDNPPTAGRLASLPSRAASRV
jgi:hypothetical protein